MRLIVRLPYALCRFHTRSFILHSNVRLLTWTSFFHSSAYTLCSLSLLFYYIRPSSILISPRFHAYCYLPSFCLYRASPGLNFFPSLLFSGSFVQCAQRFLQFLTFPIPGRSIIIALNGDVQPRIKASFPFQNILSRPWSLRISLTDGTSCWIHLVKPWICGLGVL
jgi:hypothetical protein